MLKKFIHRFKQFFDFSVPELPLAEASVPTNVIVFSPDAMVAAPINYPTYILPKENYVTRIDINSLKGNIVIVRRSNFESKEETFDELGILRTGALYTKESEIPKMSMNILGGGFNTKDIKWRQQKSNMDVWNGEAISIDDLSLNDIIELDEKRTCPIFLSLELLLEIVFPYSQEIINSQPTVEKEIAKGIVTDNTYSEVKNKKDKTIRTDVLHYKGSVIVNHSPIISNYWHVELDLTEDVAKTHIINKISSYNAKEPPERQKYLTKAAMEFFQRINAIPLITDIKFDLIDESCFLKQPQT